MGRRASQLDEPSGLGELFREGLVLAGGAIVRNPVIAGGSTAFFVALAFVTANAVWYQPHQHPGAFFATRGPAQPEVAIPRPEPRPAREPQVRDTTIFIEREPTTASVPSADSQVSAVQEVLRDLKLYTGTIDGLVGPQTAKAVEAYQQLVGLEPTGKIDAALFRQLGAGMQQPRSAEALPEAFVSADPSAPLPQARPEAPEAPVQVAARPADPHIVRIQAGLKAFGNDGIELDGVAGPKTKSAIREFQSLFGLPETGEPDAAVYAKMREIGLTD